MMFGFTGTPIFAVNTSASSKYTTTAQLFGGEPDKDGEKFQSYYKDVSLRMKNKEIDLLIVVGMFLTGFDAKTLNTLWVDKNLKLHGLLQAYSRTNRILNAVKNCGNIVCFRNLEEATNKSLAIFGDENASGLVFMRSYEEYYSKGYQDERGKEHEPYVALIRRLLEEFPVEAIANIIDEEQKKEFIRLMGEILRLRNILSAFDDFTDEAKLVDEMHYQDYLGWYNNFYEEFRRKPREDEREDKEIIVKIRRQVDASPDMRDKRELIEKFIQRMTPEKGADVGAEWEQYVICHRNGNGHCQDSASLESFLTRKRTEEADCDRKAEDLSDKVLGSLR